MATAESVKTKLQNLITLANNTTGNTDATLTQAVNALIAGFGQGGGNSIQIGESTPVPNLLNLFYALENGTAVTGEFTIANYLPATSTLIFDTGLSEINGLFYVDCDYAYTATGSKPEYGVWGLYMKNPDGLTDVQAVGLSIYQVQSNRGGYTVEYNRYIARGTPDIVNGALYVTADFGNNKDYTPFNANDRYVWVAW